jgi:hypothetical protein
LITDRNEMSNLYCQNNQHLSYFCVILFICKMRAEGIWIQTLRKFNNTKVTWIYLLLYKVSYNKQIKDIFTQAGYTMEVVYIIYRYTDH